MPEYERIFKSVTSGGTLIIYLDGDIDHHNARTVRQRIDSKLFIQRPKELVLDLSKVSFMDSSGLGLILGRLRKCNECGCEFKLVNPGAKTQRILRMAGVDKILNIQSIEI